jgi:WD40 repeat protein
MEDLWRSVSCTDGETHEPQSEVILSSRSDDPTPLQERQQSSLLRPCHSLSPTNSVDSSCSRGSKSGVPLSIASAARRKRMNSPAISPPRESLNLPSLEESRNDNERRRQFMDNLVHVKSEEGEMEVCLKHDDNAEEEKKSEASASPTRSELEIKAEEIMLEAKLASLELGGAPPTADARCKKLIQEALDRAAARSKAAAAKALSNGSAIIKSLSSDPVMQTRGMEAPRLRTTKEVLEMAHSTLGMPSPTGLLSPSRDPYPKLQSCLSPVDSTCSIDDFEKAVNRLPSRFVESEHFPRDKMLQRLDGVVSPPVTSPVSSPVQAISYRSQPPLSTHFEEDDSSIQSSFSSTVVTKSVNNIKPVVIKSFEKKEELSSVGWLDYFWGPINKDEDKDGSGDSMAPMHCGTRRALVQEELPAMSTALVRVMSDPILPSYAEALYDQNTKIRMPEWIDNQFYTREALPDDGTYQLGESRTVIVHEIMRGSWTWATAWSPDGNHLAVATDNHHLAVIDTSSSSVWRVRHDKRVVGPARPGTTHSIRAIAWGIQFIAVGGTGNAVSILAPTQPYPVLHTITPTGFVGSLHWLRGTNTLLIGSRMGKAMIVKIRAEDELVPNAVDPEATVRTIQSSIVHTIDRQKAWVNAVKFSPGGTALAVGDSKGILGVYKYDDQSTEPFTNVANFKLEDSILDLEWSPDGQWLYAGGEDFAVTVISTQWWEAVHRIKRDRWVQFMSASHGGTHVAIGGVSSEVSILDVERGWDPAINVSLNGLVPLSAQWHPHDQCLVLTGQSNSILAVETTNARYVSGHFLRSVSPIFSIEFSPDGRMAAIGNEAGIVTIFKLSGTTFISVYEMVLDCDGSLSIRWSLNGAFLAISAGNKAVIVSRTNTSRNSAPPNASGFSTSKVIRDLGPVHDVEIDPTSRFVAVSGKKTQILDATMNFKCVREIKSGGTSVANSWSPDGTWFATVGKNQNLLVYDTTPDDLSEWRALFAVQTEVPALALAWSPVMVGGLQYLAYGGEDKAIHIIEVRTSERTWEAVLNIPRDGVVYDLDWNSNGLVAAAIGNGTATVLDLSYLQSGWAVNEMDYNWQRQALTCFTEIRRNKGKHSMRCVRWIPSAPGSDTLLAVGGTDGEVEIVDLTERQRCSGFFKEVTPHV